MAKIKTKKWEDSELVTIGKYKYCYIVKDNEMIIYIPGGTTINSSELMKQGIEFVMPARIRKDVN